jgi:general secretion pathway protein D
MTAVVWALGLAPQLLAQSAAAAAAEAAQKSAEAAQRLRQQSQAAPGAANSGVQTAPGVPQAGAETTSRIVYGGLNLQNASLTEVVDMLARQLKINYVLDSRIKGGVILNTYGETKNIDTRALLDMILRINGAAMVKEGDIYRIVPLADINRVALEPEQRLGKDIEADDQEMLNLVFLKYTTAEELSGVLKNFIGNNGQIISYAPANLLLLLDSRRMMRRTMELVALFDNDALANQRVHTYEVTNGRPKDIAKELEDIFKSIALNGKNSPIRFLPIDRLNTIIAVAPNPGAFSEVSKWVEKLDVPAKSAAGGLENYVYRVKYGDATCLSQAIMSLYSGMQMMSACGASSMGLGMMSGFGTTTFGAGGMGMGGMGAGGMGMGVGGVGMGGVGMGGYGMGAGGYGMGGYGMGGYGMGGYGMGGYGMGGYGAGAYGAPPMYGNGGAYGAAPGLASATGASPGTASDKTGQYLGAPGQGVPYYGPRVIANPFNNTLMIQATPQDYVGVTKLLRDLDVPPRQVLIEARIYEVDLSGQFASGVSAYLQKLGAGASQPATGTSAVGGTGSSSISTATNPFSASTAITNTTAGAPTVTNAATASIPHQFLGSLVGNSTTLTAGTLVGMSRELLAAVNLQEQHQKAKVISAPSIIATDSIPASINVGESVPTLTAQAVTGVQSGGNSLFANSISNVSTGVTLSILARVNSSGIVTLIINQQVSSPIPPAAGSIQSPSFDNRTVQTQVTVQDGDTIAIGGIIDESTTYSDSGIPVLSHIPYLGTIFGSRSYTKQRTELVIFLEPRVIYDTNQIVDATDELKQEFHDLKRSLRAEQ